MIYFLITILSPALLGLDNFKVIEAPEFVNQGEYELGRKLFHEKKISRDNSISCSSCHQLDHFGVDNLEKSKGSNGIESVVNTPSIYNISLNKVFFIDGRVDSLSKAIVDEIKNIKRFNTSWVEIISKLRLNKDYVEKFDHVYSSEISEPLIIEALSAFLSQLVLPPSRFDRFISGEIELNTSESRGYKKFKSYGCMFCHSGALLGANLFSGKGSFYKKKEQQLIKKEKYGRYNVTKNEDDLFNYKVPSLRNIEFTSPYFYFGEVKTLSEAISKKVYYQIGEKPSGEDLEDLQNFLKTLSSPNVGEKYSE